MYQATPNDGLNSDVGLTCLPLGEQFVLWAARIWVKSNHGAPTLHLNSRNGFRVAEMEDGYLMLDRIMTLLSTRASMEISIPLYMLQRDYGSRARSAWRHC